MSKFRHLMSIKESSEFKDNIDIVNDIEDVFRFLSDDMDFDIESYFIETFKSESSAEKYKYNGEGDLVLKVIDPRDSHPPLFLKNPKGYGYPEVKLESKIWLFIGGGSIKFDKIVELCQEINKSIDLASNMMYLENIPNKSTIGFLYEGHRQWKSFYFGDIKGSEDIVQGVIPKTDKEIRVDVSIQFTKKVK